MPEVRAAAGAADFHPLVSDIVIGVFRHRVFMDGLKITGPSAPGVEFGIGSKQRGPTTYAVVDTVGIGVGILTGKGTLGSFLNADAELFGGKLRLPVCPALRIVCINFWERFHFYMMAHIRNCAIGKFPAGFSVTPV